MSTSAQGTGSHEARPAREEGRIPVIVALSNGVSGVVSWALRLRRAFHGHPRYAVRLLWCGRHPEDLGQGNLTADTLEEAFYMLAKVRSAIVVPNYFLRLFDACAELNTLGCNLRTIGFCRADSESECYAPLRWYEPVISRLAAVSPQCADRLREQSPHRAADIAVLPTGVFVPAELDRTYQREPVRLAYGGRILQRQKRVMDFVPLVRHLLSKGVDFVFDIAGSGQDQAPLEAAMDGLAHGGRVRFPGRLAPEEMDRFWSEHDIFVQASQYEGTSNSMLEAMALGTVPVVTAASSGVREVIADGENGFVVPVEDMGRMAAVIASLAAEPQRLQATGRAANQTARRYSMESYVEKFSALLNGAWAEAGRRWPEGLREAPDFGLRARLPSIAEVSARHRQRIAGLERRVTELEAGYGRLVNRLPLRLYRGLKRAASAALGRRRGHGAGEST